MTLIEGRTTLTATQLDISTEMLVYALTVGNYISKLVATLEGIEKGRAAVSLAERDLKGGVKAAQVWPVCWAEANNLVLPGVSVDVYLEPGQDVSCKNNLKSVNASGQVCAMLGAGNHGFLAVKDVLVALFEKNQVVLLKPHPMQAKWQALADHALEPLIRWGAYASVACHSLEQSKHMLYHPLVDAMHMTGGIATHDAVVWGPTKEEQEKRKAADDPLLKVPITSELGCVSPAIVVGGEWTVAQIDAQAKNLVFGFVNNNSCNCNAIKILVLPGDWPQADAFVSKFKEVLSQCPMPPAYYPGIQARYKAWHDAYPTADVITAAAAPACRDVGGPCLPYLVHTFDKVPDKPLDEYAFQNEPFAPVLNILKLPTVGTPAFLTAATAFANDGLWGSLSATFVVSPQEEGLHAEAVQTALQGLKYGMVGVNIWTGAHFMMGSTAWGAFHDPKDPATTKAAGSGIGLIGNPYLVQNVQKTVLRCPMVGAAVPVPSHLKPLPRVVVLLLTGYSLDGFRGMWRSLFHMRSK
ncbi:MAG: hypothetical protein WDW38_003660 [Sanguina aurantia]